MKKFSIKKFLLFFCMLTCVFGLTACDTSNGTISSSTAKQEKKNQEVTEKETQLKEWAVDMITYLDKNSSDKIISDAENAKGLDAVNGKEYVVNPDGMNVKTIEFYNSWNSTRDELGTLKEIKKDITIDVSTETGELCTISLEVVYSDRESCVFEFVIDDDFELVSGAINPKYTTAEKMNKALVNTLIGMGTVFVVLIFISFIISLLKYVNKLEAKGKKEDTTASQGVDNAIAQIVSNEEQEADDLELIAVITAAIAAYEGTSSDGLVVRSIRKVNNRRR